jgi:hypothetical protein
MPSNIQQYKNYIILHNVGFQDSRYYICTATNAAGSTIKAIHVVVISRRKLLLSRDRTLVGFIAIYVIRANHH